MGAGDGQSDRRKRKKSRWATDETVDKTIIPGMPTVLPGNLSKEQERQYICKSEIDYLKELFVLKWVHQHVENAAELSRFRDSLVDV